jgi:hypothetical protein
MAEDKDYFGEKLRLAERAREDAYFRKLDQALIAQMRQQDRDETVAAAPAPEMFTSILVPVDFSTYSADALRYAAGIAARFASSIMVLPAIPAHDLRVLCDPWPWIALIVFRPSVSLFGRNVLAPN